MKRKMALCLCALLLLGGCRASTAAPTSAPAPTAEASPAPTPAPAPAPTPAPTVCTTPTEVVTREARAVLAVLERGELLRIEDEWEDYYVVSAAAGRGYVEKRLVALESEAVQEARTVYAKKNAEFFTGYLLRGEPERLLEMNTELLLWAELGDCCLVELEGALGYVPAEMLADSPIRYSGHSGGSAPSGGADGGDITLRARGERPRRAAALADGASERSDAGEIRPGHVISVTAELYSAIYHRGEMAPLLSREGESCTLYVDGVLSTVESRCLRSEGAEPFAAKTVYAASGAAVYRDLCLRGEVLEKPAVNTELTLLEELGDCCLVSLPGGAMGYIAPEQLSEQPLPRYAGGGSAPSGGEWTEPAL